MNRFAAALAIGINVLLWNAPAQAASAPGKLVFAVVVTRHGVRSFTKAPVQYTWPDWTPVAPGFLTAHGYRLMTFMGAFYREYFAAQGLDVGCASHGTYVYADRDQRTLATARALIEGACGTDKALPIFHVEPMSDTASDPIFGGAAAFAPEKIDAATSKAAVLAALPSPPAGIVTQHAAAFAGIQRILSTRCGGTCAPAADGETLVAQKKNIAEMTGPVDTASSYAESLFLETAECGPSFDGNDLAAAMSLHVLEYDINARNAYNPWVRGGNLLAHIVALMEKKAGDSNLAIDSPDIGAANVVVISGHDTQLGALGGILGAHWAPGNGLVVDDNPPGGALIFELYRTDTGEYVVRVRFASESLAQMRRSTRLPDGESAVDVRFDEGTMREAGPLAAFEHVAQRAIDMGFVSKTWTPSSDAPFQQAPLVDPPWSHCEQ